MLLGKLLLNKTTIIIGIIVLLLIAVGVQTERAARFKIGKQLAENQLEQAVTFANNERREVEVFKNANGNLVHRVEELQMNNKTLSDLRETDRAKFLKEFERLKKDYKNLEDAGVFEFGLETDSIPMVSATLPCKDSINVFKYKYVDEYNHIEATVVDTPVFKVRVPVYTIDTWDRKWFLGRKRYYREATSPNKLVVMEIKEYFTVTKLKKKK